MLPATLSPPQRLSGPCSPAVELRRPVAFLDPCQGPGFSPEGGTILFSGSLNQHRDPAISPPLSGGAVRKAHHLSLLLFLSGSDMSRLQELQKQQWGQNKQDNLSLLLYIMLNFKICMAFETQTPQNYLPCPPHNLSSFLVSGQGEKIKDNRWLCCPKSGKGWKVSGKTTEQ